MLLNIEATDYLPRVTLSQSDGVLYIAGKSYPQNADQFYIPVIAKINDYLKNPHSTTTINLEIEYFQTTSQRYLLQILAMFVQKIPQKDLVFNWWYYDEDGDEDDYIFAGKEIEKILNAKFNFIKK
ncbi:MAG: DUF1987 domain-containing protein [Bacteroidetes bacterium]|nr:DUF1987 domain-containing protein [Bacteroidota bacterium]